MKRAIKYFLFLWPIPVLVYLVFIALSSQANIAEKLTDANGLIWGEGDKQITAHVKQTSAEEKKLFEILLIRNNSQTPEKFMFAIDEDMWGGGFVKAVQADSDPELELIAWGIHENLDSFLMDYHEGEVSKLSFANSAKEIQELTVKWRQAHIVNGMTLSLFAIFAVIYYIFVGIIWLIVKTVRKGRIAT